MDSRKTIAVCCAVVIENGLVLIARRSGKMSMPDKWEFPGGKIEDGEDPKNCLRREIEEELGVKIFIGDLLGTFMHDYPGFSIILHAFSVKIQSGNLFCQEHSELKWVNPSELRNFDFTEADLPIVKLLQEMKI